MTRLLARFATIFAAASALAFGVVSTAQAQSCTPTAPRTDTGAGFVPFGATEQVLARGGNNGPAWEWAVGTDTAGTASTRGNLDWVSGKVYNWTVTYNGAGSATLQVHDAGNVVLNITYPTGMDAGNAIRLHVGTNSSIGSSTTISAAISSLAGQAVSGAVSQTGNGTASEQNQFWFYPGMSTGFVAQGTVSLTYASLPTGGRVQFTLQAGTIPCGGGGNTPPTVSISAPAANSIVNAPANITVSANAADSDGTVAQVQFFANGNPIGTATSSPYSINWANVAAGSYSLTAVATDNGGATTTSAAVPIVVNATPTVSITAPAAGAVIPAGSNATVTATAADTDGTITQVQFFANGNPIGTATSSPYSVAWSGMAAGSYTLTAVATDNRGAQTTSSGVAVIVNAAPTVSITAPAAATVVQAGSNVTVTASATDPDGTVAQVQFFANGNPIGTATASPFTISWANVAAGNYTLTAVATDNRGAQTTSAGVAVTVNAGPSVSITAPTVGTVVQAGANVTVTATATDPDGTIASVQFFANGNPIGTATASPYSITWANVASGSYTLTAIATDNAGGQTTSSGVAIVANASPTVSITAPASGTVVQAGASVAVTAVASDSDGNVTQVQFFANGNPIGTATSSPYTITWSNVAAGSYNLTAVATDNAGSQTTSSAVAIVANAGPSVSITSPANGAVFAAGTSVAVSANAADSDGSVSQVEFFANGVSIGIATSSPYSVSWSPSAGSYSLTAVATDNAGGTTTSATVTVTINAQPVVAITSPAANATFTAPASITLTATASDPDGTIASVQFFANGSPIGVGSGSPYTFVWTNVAVGAYSLTAVATDNNGATTTSAAVPVTVGAAQAKLYFIHTDHLNTPRLVADDTQKTVWKWEQQEPFGAGACNPDPDGDNVQFEFNLRFPGQYFDRETNLHYNWFRDYDPTIGRYAQSDPLGIDADLNTYAYSNSDPIALSDLFGLAPAGRSGGGPRGERGATGGAAGQNSKLPYKKCREFEPPDPDWVNCQHHQTGKWIKVRRPATMPYRPTKPDDCHAAFVVCAGGASRAGVLAPAIVFMCAKNYENCLRTCP